MYLRNGCHRKTRYMNYRYQEFKWMANGQGFDYPVDVYNNTVYLGTLLVNPEGYSIYYVDTPKGKQQIEASSKNMFKTKEIAAEILHRTWKIFRQGPGDTLWEPEPSPVPA